MRDVSVLAGARPTGRRSQYQVVTGYVSLNQLAPASFTDALFVVVPSHSPDIAIEFVEWPKVHGGTLPVAGDTVVVAFTEDGVPHCIGWEGVNS